MEDDRRISDDWHLGQDTGLTTDSSDWLATRNLHFPLEAPSLDTAVSRFMALAISIHLITKVPR